MRIAIAMIVVLVAMPGLARAQDIDPDGAIHAMTGRHRNHRHRVHQVRIPHSIHRRRHDGILLPPGTSKPGPSRNFIPAR